MISGWTIYWITRLDAIQVVFGAATVLSVVALLVGRMALFDGVLSPKEYAKMIAVCVIGPLLFVFTPSTKEACAILVVPRLVADEDVQGLGDDMLQLAREWMQELRPKEEDK